MAPLSPVTFPSFLKFKLVIRAFLRSLLFELQGWRSAYFFRRPLVWALVPALLTLVLLKKSGRWDRPGAFDPASLINEQGVITGVVAAHPDARLTGCVYVMEVETFKSFEDNEAEVRSVQGRLLLHVSQSTSPQAGPGDRLSVWGRLQEPRPARTPGAFDYKSYLENQNIHTLLYTSEKHIRFLGPSGRFKIKKWGWTMKTRVIKVFENHLSPPAAAVLAGLVVGQRPRFHPEVRRIFLESGTMHVLVASGSNIAFVMALWTLLAQFVFRLPRKAALASSVLAIGWYAVLVGADAPILRASVMGLIGLLYYLQSREDRPYQALALAAWVLLLLSPSSLFDVGFQMSFLTVFGMIHTWPLLELIFPNAPWLIRRLCQAALTTTAAQLWLLPLTAQVFHQLYPIGFISNIVVIPLAALGLPAGLLLAIFPPIDGAVQWYLTLLINMVQFFAEHPGWILLLPPFPFAAIVAFYTLLLTAAWIRGSAWARVLFVSSAAVLLFFSGRFFLRAPSTTISWIDLGRSIGTLIQNADGSTVLYYPGGPPTLNERVLIPFLSTKAIRKIDRLMVPRESDNLQTNIQDLKKWIQIGEVKVEDSLFMRVGSNLIIQARTSRVRHWPAELLQGKPLLIVDTGFPNEIRKIPSSWKNVPMVFPQELGFYELAIVIPDG